MVYFSMNSLQYKKKKSNNQVCCAKYHGRCREVQESKDQAQRVNWSLEDIILLFFRAFQVISSFTNDQALKIYIN